MNEIFRRTLGPLAAAAGLAALGIGCAGGANAQATPKRGGTAVIGVSVAGATLNTQLTSAVTPLIIADLWASGLFKYDKAGNKKPQIASSWEISKDGKVYTFHLRPNLKWSDGHPFSSEDVAFTLNAFAKYNTYLVKVLPNIDRVETPDANTFVVTLKEPQSAALEGFDKEVFPLMPKHVYDGTDIPTNPANRAPVGMGPYKFVSWEEGRGITFTRNEYYWDQPKPYLDSVVAVFIPNVQQQQNALYRGEIDVLRPALPQIGRTIEQAKAKNAFEVREIKVNAAERLSLDVNITRDTLNKPLIRQALLTAIDRERISKDVYQGLAFPAMNAIPEQFTKLTDPSVDYNKQFAYDPAKAGKMLDDAGFPLKDGKRFTVDFTGAVNADAFYAEPAAQIIAANWRAIGVDVKLSLLEGQLWTNKVFKDRNYDVSMVSLTARTDPLFGVDRSFLCNSTNVPYVNPTGYCNPDLDAIAAKAAAVPLEERRQWYKQYEEIIARDMPHLTLTNAKKFFAISSRFGGIDEEMDLAFNGNPSMASVWVK
ncbi:MAG TPA: ABC transporter substrate-binding protein [Reyranella sp.]|jgi:peptide/nickel transport system substrate-binding protein